MKIVDVKTYITQPTESADGWSLIKPFIFVRLETEEGVVGWGEAYSLSARERGIEEMVLSLGRSLLEVDDITPRAFRQLAKSIEANTPGLDFSSAVSGVEIALWDAYGKIYDAPIYDLLGGALTREIPLYVNTWTALDSDIPALADRCRQLVAQGYRAVKIYPRKYGDVKEVGECVRNVRETLGEDIEIALDLSLPNNAYLSLQIAREVAPYRPYWFEEPISGEHLDVLADIRRQSGLRIVTGEKHAGKEHARDVLVRRAADILNTDIAGCGGIIEMLEIGAMADAHAVFVSPHCWNSMTVALAAMLHTCAVMPNAELAEIYPDFLVHGEQFCRLEFDIDNGVAMLNDAPGLGITIDEAALAAISTINSATTH